jgi:hypothetical protein
MSSRQPTCPVISTPSAIQKKCRGCSTLPGTLQQAHTKLFLQTGESNAVNSNDAETNSPNVQYWYIYSEEESFGKLVLLSLTIVYCRNQRVAHYRMTASLVWSDNLGLETRHLLLGFQGRRQLGRSFDNCNMGNDVDFACQLSTSISSLSGRLIRPELIIDITA